MQDRCPESLSLTITETGLFVGLESTPGGAKKASECRSKDGFSRYWMQSATKSEKTYLASLVMTETTNNTGLVFPTEIVATRGNTLPIRIVRLDLRLGSDPE